MSSPKGWSLVEADWNSVARLVADRDWKRTYLEPDYEGAVPRTSGVYIMCVEAPVQGGVFQKLYNSVYVGQAINLRKRFKDHLQGYGDVVTARSTFQRIHFWYALAERDELSKLEQCLIDALGPSANRKNAIRARAGEPVAL